jgi:hypothetical protein
MLGAAQCLEPAHVAGFFFRPWLDKVYFCGILVRMTIQNKGVEILLNRMKSHPEEFIDDLRWGWVIIPLLDRVNGVVSTTHHPRTPLAFLSDEEINSLYDAYMALQGGAFSKRVMRELLVADGGEDKR